MELNEWEREILAMLRSLEPRRQRFVFYWLKGYIGR